MGFFFHVIRKCSFDVNLGNYVYCIPTISDSTLQYGVLYLGFIVITEHKMIKHILCTLVMLNGTNFNGL